MAQVSYDFVEKTQNNNANNQFANNVGFFSLKNDGDDAIVRILHDSVNDFDIVSQHEIEIDGKRKKVNCIREMNDPASKCPFCETQTGRLTQRIYIHLLQYTKDENGNLVVLPKIWERSVSYARTLKGYIDEYGPLSNLIFKIRRSGAAGSKDTTYSLLPQISPIYSEQNFPKNTDAFKNYSVVGTIVMNKSYEDMVAFIRNGSFPQQEKAEAQPAGWGNTKPNDGLDLPPVSQFIPNMPNQTGIPVQPTYTNIGGIPMSETTIKQVPVEPSFTEAIPKQQMPWETTTSPFNNPPRRY